MNASELDIAAAHCYFAAFCFNTAWDLIDKAGRSPEDDEQMLRLAQASLWHWTQRPDCTPTNLSIGYWQVSRVYALLHRPADALRYADLCLKATPDDEPHLMGYAHEAAARAAFISGDRPIAREHLSRAKGFASKVSDADDRQGLERDLQELESACDTANP